MKGFLVPFSHIASVRSADQLQVTLSAIIDPTAFGTCNLTLFGIRSRTYHFTVLALTHLKAQVQPAQKVPPLQQE